ncbi:histidine--tRNA ligase, cytoplasmic isoform X1 [Vigna radiata var. radiata]|uniref:Histidine--tRNA ligase, cytoplasmic n=1 Tax=Vigna radiata var. radiata TaxID=3916 RepID=A0A3Q0FBD8_VIGRR|nr:histidine--tRNA ligase, cytoplasmic isoform X1 [Vigna radiata var. radiata]
MAEASVTLGGKASSLSSSAVCAVAAALSQVRIDSTALDRLSSSSKKATTATTTSSSSNHSITVPDFLTLEESRAFLLVLLNSLIISNAPSRTPLVLAETLNSNPSTFRFDDADLVTEDELACSTLLGISAILDHHSAALSALADVAAAFSCEALKADVAAFNLMDSGDGHNSKEEVGVAADLRVLLNGSKSVGKEKVRSVARVPKVHGSVREHAKAVHSRMRVELNSGVKSAIGSEEAVCTVLLPLAAALRELGECSLARAKSNLEGIGGDDLKLGVGEIFCKECPVGDGLSSGFNKAVNLFLGKEYGKFAHEVFVLLGLVWKVVAWEVVTAVAVLEAAELNEVIKGANENGENPKVEENSKAEKKKKKVVLGKGTSSILALFKERLQSRGKLSLGTWVADFLSFFDLTKPEFNEFLLKVKDVVESNESRRLPKIPKGTRDFAKEQMTIRKKAFSIIEEVFERHGATALDTPVFELRETLMGKYGEDSKLIYDLADQGGELLSLRYDLTVPFARFVAMNGLTSFKRYQIAKVYRRDNPSKGRYREFYQCDFDIAGTPPEKMGPDFEVVRILTELLDELNIGEYEIKLNHRKLLDGMMQICGVPPEKFRTICSSIDKLDKQSFQQIKKEMVEEKGLTAETADRIETFVKEKGSPLALLSKFIQEGSDFSKHEGASEALKELEILFIALEKSKRIDKVVFDLSLARGLDYYTGVIFEAVFKGGTQQVGSIAAGGRYDNLIGMFGSKTVPAVGVSLGIERVFAIMEQQQKDQNQMARPTKTEVLVSILGNDLTLAAELAGELWDAGVKAEFLVHKRRTKHFEYAKESRIPWMVLVYEQEVKEEGVVQLKDLEANIDIKTPRTQFVEELRKRLYP